MAVGDGGFVHLDDDTLDLVRVNIKAGHENHVLLAILDIDETTLVHAADVPGTEPPARKHDVCRFLRFVPVAFHDLRATNTDFSELAERNFISIVIANAGFGRRARRNLYSWPAGHGRLLAQSPPQNLADVGFWQFVAEFDFFGHFVTGQVFAAITNDVVGRHGRFVLYDEKLDDFT